MDEKELQQFILEKRNLFWFIPDEKLSEIDNDAIVETILNYGDMATFIKLFDIMGIKNVAEIFYNSINSGERKRNNYQELTIDYFTKVFNRYAP